MAHINKPGKSNIPFTQ